MFSLTCSIITHILKIDEKFNCLLVTNQTSFSKLSYNNYNTIQICQKNLQIGMITYFYLEACHKKLDSFSKVRSHIVHN
jgi:hypothetical protein